MRKSMSILFLVATIALAHAAFGKGECKFSDVAKLKDHVSTHIKYPAKGKDIKQACKKEIPDEFTKAERACAASKIKDGTEYKDAGEVLKALGVE